MRKFIHKQVITMNSEQIRLAEDEWFDKYNKVFYNINTNKVG